MRAVRVAAVVGGAVAVFLVALALTFPTDALVRGFVARTTPPAGPTLTFARAALRPWGLRLDDVVVLRPDGTSLARLDAITLRPSLRGLVRDGRGLPWHGRLAACGGTADAVLDADGDGHALTLAWRDVDLASCPTLAATGEVVAGRVDGHARLSRTSAAGTVGLGQVRLRSGAWTTRGRLPGIATLHLDPAELEWRLGASRLLLDRIDLSGPELLAVGQGTVALAPALGQSGVDVALAVTAGPAAPAFVRDLLSGLPPAPEPPGARALAVGGTLDALRLVH